MKKFDIQKFEQYVAQNSTEEIKKNILSVIKGRICHHKVRFLNLLVNFMEGDIKNYLEIGVHNVASMSYVLQSKYKVENCVGIDLFEDTFYKDNLSYSKNIENFKTLNVNNNNIKLVKGNSASTDTINEVNNLKYDLIFIDGDHSYDGIKNDFNNYYLLLSDNGILVFDDFNKGHHDSYDFINSVIDSNIFKFNYEFIDNEHIGKYKNGIIAFSMFSGM